MRQRPVAAYRQLYTEARAALRTQLDAGGMTPEQAEFTRHHIKFYDEELVRLQSSKDEGFLDIENGRPLKTGILAGLRLFYTFARAQRAMIGDLESSPRAHIRQLHGLLRGIAADMANPHQARIILEVGECLLWIADKDSAYQDPFQSFIARLQAAPKLAVDVPVGAWWMNMLVKIEEWDGR